MNDAQARRAARDVSRSFIVQAPAGSGKTELLIQRYLALLASVEVPEQIVAITFTRKAAAEMRARVTDALKSAAAQAIPAQPHRRETHALALRALDRDQARGWAVIEHPQRLKIDTLDSLNAWLAQRLPLLAGGVAGARIVEAGAQDHYALAARRLVDRLEDATPTGTALRRILEHAHGGVERMEALLAGLLGTRDQWLPHLLEADGIEALEHALRRLIDDELAALRDVLPARLTGELVALLRHGARHAADPATRDALAAWRTREQLPPPHWRHLEAWQAMATLLLTRQGQWRRQLGGVGFTPRHPAPRRRLAELIEGLSGTEALRRALVEVAKLPGPQLAASHRAVLAALREVLHHLTAELKLLYVERNTVDFVELALAAQHALGRVDAPSELLLALDQRLQHVLVDEFQDTSHTQLRLLQLLTAGWVPGDGRTLFVVGDPMQSIYRFRNADMALFLNARRRGVGDIPCESLVLDSNFRSRPALVAWINRTFAQVFPQRDDLKTGAARFSPSTATREPCADQGVAIHALRGTDPEAEVRVVTRILMEERARSATASVAVLVQNRHHLAGLTEALRPLDLPIHAVEIEAPNRYQVTQDLIGLTRALAHLGDRIAWLSVLHAPWCGMTWADLHALCWDDLDGAIWTLMNDAGRTARLSPDGRDRLERTRGVLDLAFRTRGAQSFARWVESTWISLRGPACLDAAEDLQRAEHFFLTLADAVTHGDLDDPSRLEERFTDPRVGVDVPREQGIEIMTIHRAKGLEFDTVILLGLGREPPSEQDKGLYWLQRLSADGRQDVLLAPPASNAREPDALTEWIKRVDRLKDSSERARLLYVATTRARERLHLVGQLPPGKSPRSSTLLARLWPCVSHAFDAAEPTEPVDRPAGRPIRPVLRRLVEPATAPASAPDAAQEVARPEFEWAGQAAVHVGSVVHGELHRVAEDGIAAWDAARVTAHSRRFEDALRLLGVEDGELAWATARVVRALQQVLDDPTGRWLLANHPQARSELTVTVVSDSTLQHLRLDRTFVDARGTRWIIDFKTSAHEGGARDAFLASEVARYRPQLERYASALSRLEDRPMRVGLYFPLLQTFEDWEPVLR